MVENNLTRALRIHLAKALENFRLPVQNGEMRQPQIVNGFLPPKRSKDGDDFPFVIIRPSSGSTERENTDTLVDIIIGCYSEDMDGYELCLNVLSRIRNALTMMPNQTIDGRFRLGFPISWKLDETQPYPLWQIDMQTRWQSLTPEIRPERKEETYGYFNFEKG